MIISPVPEADARTEVQTADMRTTPMPKASTVSTEIAPSDQDWIPANDCDESLAPQRKCDPTMHSFYEAGQDGDVVLLGSVLFLTVAEWNGGILDNPV